METISFELSKKLKKLGFIQQSGCTFAEQIGIKAISKEALAGLEQLEEENITPYFKAPKDLGINAYTLDEIIKFLPVTLDDDDIGNGLMIGKIDDSTYIATYVGEKMTKYGFTNKNPAEAAGDLLAWCIENGYVETNKKEK